jgi:hypothetical protein
VPEPIELGGRGGEAEPSLAKRSPLDEIRGLCSIDAFELNDIVRRLLELLCATGCTPRAGLAWIPRFLPDSPQWPATT